MVKILDEEYKCAYKEVYMIIENSDDDIKSKIPKDKIEFYKSHMDTGYEFELDLDKELSEQNLLYPTRCILANLFRDYIATEEDRAEILKEEQEELNQIEEEKRKKYNPDDIFKDNSKPKVETAKIEVAEIHTEEMQKDLALLDENITWFEKVKNKIFEFLNKFFKKK